MSPAVPEVAGVVSESRLATYPGSPDRDPSTLDHRPHHSSQS